MEVLTFAPPFLKSLWDLKVMCSQHVDNGKEIKELQSFIEDYDKHVPALRDRFKNHGGGDNTLGIVVLQQLEAEIVEATNKLEKWSRNQSFCRVFNSAERMAKIEKLHSRVMASVQKSLGIASLSMLIDLRATQSTILQSNLELKSLLISKVKSMHGILPSEVRNDVVEASTSSFVDPKFWQDILAAIDDQQSEKEAMKLYEDPITMDLMIDPIVASDGNTYCRWTIIDNGLTKDPCNSNEDFRIVIDNLASRRGLFEKFPEQLEKFLRRRVVHRRKALSLKGKGLWSDAVLALQYVVQWDKNDEECAMALKEVQGLLKAAREQYVQPSVVQPHKPGPKPRSGSARSRGSQEGSGGNRSSQRQDGIARGQHRSSARSSGGKSMTRPATEGSEGNALNEHLRKTGGGKPPLLQDVSMAVSFDPRDRTLMASEVRQSLDEWMKMQHPVQQVIVFDDHDREELETRLFGAPLRSRISNSNRP